MSHIFISYSHQDSEYAHKLAEALEQVGLLAWIDKRINYGTEWPIVIQERLDNCEAFIVIMSPRSYQSKWVQNELSRAQEKRKPIFPLLLEGDVWLSVQATQYSDVRGDNLPPQRFFDTLAQVLQSTVRPAGQFGTPKVAFKPRTFATWQGNVKTAREIWGSPLTTAILWGVTSSVVKFVVYGATFIYSVLEEPIEVPPGTSVAQIVFIFFRIYFETSPLNLALYGAIVGLVTRLALQGINPPLRSIFVYGVVIAAVLLTGGYGSVGGLIMLWQFSRASRRT